MLNTAKLQQDIISAGTEAFKATFVDGAGSEGDTMAAQFGQKLGQLLAPAIDAYVKSGALSIGTSIITPSGPGTVVKDTGKLV